MHTTCMWERIKKCVTSLYQPLIIKRIYNFCLDLFQVVGCGFVVCGKELYEQCIHRSDYIPGVQSDMYLHCNCLMVGFLDLTFQLDYSKNMIASTVTCASASAVASAVASALASTLVKVLYARLILTNHRCDCFETSHTYWTSSNDLAGQVA